MCRCLDGFGAGFDDYRRVVGLLSMQMMMRCWFDDDDVMDVGRKARKKIFMGPPFFIGRA